MRTILSVILLLVGTVAYSQNSPQITISSEKVKVDGVVKFVHHVKAGETLYSLSKAYKVSVDEIVRNNESLKAGLKDGATIFIPDVLSKSVTENKSVDEKVKATAAPSVAPSATTSVAPSAPQFELSKENIKKYSRKKHSVKWFESLESIAKKYDVEVDAIMVFNNLQSAQVKKKQIIYIPNQAFMQMYNAPALEKEEQKENKVADVATIEEVEDKEVENDKIYTSSGKGIKLTYILPLNLRDSAKLSYNFMDFYAGALLAMNDAKERGYKIDATVIEQQGRTVESLAGDTKGSNFIIGPVMGSDIAKLLPLIDTTSTLVSPLDQNSERLIAGNGNFIQVPPTQMTQIKNFIALFQKKYTGTQNVVLISESNGSDAAFVKGARMLLDTAGIKYTPLSYGILQGRDILEKIQGCLKPQVENFVIVPSNSEAFVSDVVRNLNLLCTNPVEENNRNITLFGTARWRNFETIEVDYFHRMNLHLSIPYFVEYGKEEVKSFLMRYRALYGAEPTPFAFQGYDITSYLILYPNQFAKMLQSNFNITKKGLQDGFENTSTIDIIYNKDYTISVID